MLRRQQTQYRNNNLTVQHNGMQTIKTTQAY